ncbi:MAG: ArnT family glycosyltransferase [Candidatus Rifleibacteriota bacterium]
MTENNQLWTKRFWIFICLAMLVKLAMALFFDLAPDEAYYWEYSRRLDLSYFDHPPMVGYMIAMLKAFLGDTVLAVRGFALIANFLVSLILFTICRNYFESARVGFFCALLFQLNPASLALGFIMTPDTPLSLFWGLCLLTFLKILKDPEPVFPWIIMGICLGLGAMSKYNMILIVPAVAASILVFPERRKLVFTARFWLMVLLAFAGTIPILIWNYQNEWASLKFQFSHGLKPGQKSFLFYLGEFLGGQLGTLGPSIFILIFYLSFTQFYKSFKSKNEKVFFLAATVLPALLLFTYSGLKTKVEANWPQIAYLGGFPLMAHWLVSGWSKKRAGWTILPGAILALIALIHSATLILPFKDISYRLHGWEKAGKLLKKVDEETGKKSLFVGQGYGITAEAAFYGNIPPERTAETHSGKNYRFWNSKELIKNAENVVYVDEDDYSEAAHFGKRFNKQEFRQHEIHSNGRLIRKLNISIFSDPKESDKN